MIFILRLKHSLELVHQRSDLLGNRGAYREVGPPGKSGWRCMMWRVFGGGVSEEGETSSLPHPLLSVTGGEGGDRYKLSVIREISPGM